MIKMRQGTKFCGDRWNHCWDMVIFRFSKMTAVRHLGFVMRVFGPPVMHLVILSPCKVWLESMQFR